MVYVDMFYDLFGGLAKGKVQKLFFEKLTNISFAFTHTYALKKFKKFLFSQVYIEKFKKCAKTPKKKTSWKGGGGAITAPCGQDTIPYGSKPLL